MKTRDKICKFCKTSFHDESKGNWRQTCSTTCSKRLRVEHARAGGAYNWDDARRKKSGDTVRMNQMTGVVLNPWTRDDVKLKIRATNLQRYGVENWKQTSEGRIATIRLNQERIRTPEERQKHSINARKQMKGGLKSRGKAGKRPDLPGFYRSTWEANYARILVLEGKTWEYEPKTFSLSSGISYTPDFLVDDCYIEIKGWMDTRSKRQLDEFVHEYPNEKVQIIGPQEYFELKQRYAHLIGTWE